MATSRWSRRFEVGQWFDFPAYGMKGGYEEAGYVAGSCPVAEAVHEKIINLPTHQSGGSKRFIEGVVASVNKDDVVDAETLMGIDRKDVV